MTLETSRPGVYAGGGMLRPDEPWSPVASIADGRRAALSIDRQLQRVSLSASREDRGAFVTGLVVNLAGVEDVPPAAPAEPARGFTLTEAADEAGRCLQCACLECIKVCPYLEAYGAYPGAYARRVFVRISTAMATKASAASSGCHTGAHHSLGMRNSRSLVRGDVGQRRYT